MQNEMNFNFNEMPGITPDSETVIRTGKAAEIHDEKAVEFSGILSAPADYLERKQGNWEPAHCHVRVDWYGGKITLYTNERTFNKNVITGELFESRNLTKFGINTGKEYSNFELAALFRTNKYWFADAEEHANIIAELNKFHAQITTDIKLHNENNGNSLQHLEKRVKNINWNRFFRLNVPLFQGYDRVVVPVEIAVMPSASSVKFFLESPELYELIEQQKGGLITEQTERFDAWGCSVVRIS